MNRSRSTWPGPTLLGAILVLLCFQAAGCGGGGGSSGGTTPAEKTRWTYMVYMAADNNLSDSGLGDINEMEQIGSTSDVNIVVQAEFSSQYSVNAPAGTLRGRITRDDNILGIGSALTNIGNRNMADRATLAEFISWAAAAYPADRYALVIWDHGDGWKAAAEESAPSKGAISDDTSGGDLMPLPDIAGAVRDSGVHFSMINFDACFMGMYEVAYEFLGTTDFMAFSEEAVPGDGDPFNSVLEDLTANPSMTGRELALTTTSRFQSYYEGQGRSSVMKSAVDMAGMAEFHTRLTGLVSLIARDESSVQTQVRYARDNSLACQTRPTYHDLRSLLDIMGSMAFSADILASIAQLKTSLAGLVIADECYAAAASSTVCSMSGLAVYLPSRSQVTDTEVDYYAELSCNQPGNPATDTWADLVDMLISYDEDSGMDPLPTATGGFTVWLEWDSDADLDLIIWEPDGTLSAPFVGSSSANGFFSPDSATSGESYEYFHAYDSVESGPYDILVYYYADGTSSSATAYLAFMDPSLGLSELNWLNPEGRLMSLSRRAPADWMSSDIEMQRVWGDVYSDWYWYYNDTLLYRSAPWSGRSVVDEPAPKVTPGHGTVDPSGSKGLQALLRWKTPSSAKERPSTPAPR
ncbi:MAG TPA: clostripain-related cysteine peptidase [Deltaproteobacteria bacterium]|nr:clostripain-related cysteine peptidase [Deltaproteobacteria bacterium]